MLVSDDKKNSSEVWSRERLPFKQKCWLRNKGNVDFRKTCENMYKICKITKAIHRYSVV